MVLISDKGKSFMDKVLKAANELGLMIKETDVYRAFTAASTAVEADEEGSKLLQEYSRVAEELQRKEDSGVPIEVFEKEQFQKLVEAVQESDLLVKFLESRNRYIEFLALVQNAIQE